MSTVPQSKVLDLPQVAARLESDQFRAAMLLNVTVHAVRPGTVVVTACGEVDLFSAPLLRDRLHEHVNHGGPDLVVDLTGVRFFGAAGLTVLVSGSRAASVAEVGFCVVAHTRVVLMPLMITGLLAALDVYPDLAQVPMRPRLPIQRATAS